MVTKTFKRKISIREVCRQVLFCGGVLSYEQNAFAQEASQLLDLPLDQLVNVEVTTASRFKQKSSEAPSAVDVVTAQDIRSYGWRTLADALSAMRGLNVRNDRSYSYLGIRGFSHTGDFNSRVLIMIDGRRMNDAIYDGATIAEEFLLDMNLIDRIEYIPGSGSSVYGANALLGVINVITKQGKDFNGVRVSGEAGSLDTYRGRATFGKQWKNGADLLINGSRFFSHGEEQLFFPKSSSATGGIAQDMDIERSSRLFGKLSYQDFTLRAGYVNRYKRIPTGPISNDNRLYNVDRQYYVDLDYNTQINSNLGMEARAFHHWYDYHSITPYDGNWGVAPLNPIVNFDAVDSRWWGGELKLTGTQFKSHKWVAGVEVQYDQRQHLINYDINHKNFSNNHGWRAGVYAQDEWRITDSLLINVGLRLDHHHMIQNLQLHPRIGLIWDVTPTLTTKLLYGSAFRAPNVYERDLNIPAFNFLKNPNNKEELIHSYEAVAEWYAGKGVKLLGTLFYNDLKQVLVQNTDGQFINSGAYQTYGFELGGEKRWDNGRHLKLTWTHNYTRDENLNGGSWAPDSPKNLVKLHYAEPLFNDTLRLGFEELFVDRRRTLDNNIAPSYHLLNINLAFTKPIYGFQPTLGIYNVLGHHYRVLGGPINNQDTLAMDGRTVRFRLEYGF
ncbi:TonB-dependent receptor plug [Crenothrix polyspora]|uniref:TonB-dependent receptor plug n=1 Tax=Crenothrix polyspora TaxID=360316 RepID=A0A1R4H9E3_9GAMM|nr:TonB-dependent receptor [Crenothrix polyspora]SJM92843.1 TonB-dependent receptor plug [Crenothrix polyspora]